MAPFQGTIDDFKLNLTRTIADKESPFTSPLMVSPKSARSVCTKTLIVSGIFIQYSLDAIAIISISLLMISDVVYVDPVFQTKLSNHVVSAKMVWIQTNSTVFRQKEESQSAISLKSSVNQLLDSLRKWSKYIILISLLKTKANLTLG